MSAIVKSLESEVLGLFGSSLGEFLDDRSLNEGFTFDYLDKERFVGSLETKYRISVSREDEKMLDVGGYDSSVEKYVFTPNKIIEYISSIVEERN